MNYRIIPLDAHTWRIEEISQPCDAYMYLVEGTQRAYLIDTGYGRIDLPSVVGSLTRLPVEVINTHYHGDHVGGNPWFARAWLHEADLPYYDSVRQRLLSGGDALAQLWENEKTELLPITDGQVFDLGGRSLRVIHTPGHSAGCICLLDPDRRWLFGGDTCCRADVLLNIPGSTSAEVYGESIARLQALRSEFDVIWPGHHSVPVAPHVLDQFAEGVRRLLAGERGFVTETKRGPAGKLLYGDIGIIDPR